MRSTVVALMLIALPACSNLEVKTRQDWDTDFTQYRTDAWSRGAAALDPSIESRIQAAVDFELAFKALKKVELERGSADLHVSTYASAEEERVATGTLVIDLVDARSGKLVWRGRATRVVDRQISEEALRKVVREIFRHYPWRG